MKISHGIAKTVNESGTLAGLTDFAERLYWRMLGVSDEWGRLDGEPGKVRARCVSRLDRTEAEVAAGLEELVKAGRIELYLEAGIWTCQVTGADEYMPSKARSERNLRNRHSRWPEKTPASVVDHDALLHAREGAHATVDFDFDVPAKEEGGLGLDSSIAETDVSATSEPRQTIRRGRRRDAHFETLLEVCGIEAASLTESGRGAVNRALRELRAVGATPEEIRRRAARYRVRYSLPLTPSALAKHWAALATDLVTRPAANGSVGGLSAREILNMNEAAAR
jgi:hypothetical protein